MNDLLICFNRIDNWLQKNYPKVSKAFNLGITDIQIQETAYSLPFIFSQEVYKLYQWHNGTGTSIFRFNALGGMHFYPLIKSLDIYQNNIRELDSYGLWKTNWFPIFYGDPITYFVVCKDYKLDSSPIYSSDSKEHSDSPFTQKYDNLTTMMQTIAECFEMKAFEWTSEGNFRKDRKIINECYLRFNPISHSMKSI